MPVAAPDAQSLEKRVDALGRELLGAAQKRKRAFWARQRWEEALFTKLMSDHRFRTQALRFVDVMPALTDDGDLVRHVREYFADDDLPIPGLARWSLEKASGTVANRILASTVRTAMHALAGRFIGGENVKQATRTVQGLRKKHRNFTLDLLGEATVNETEADHYQALYLRLLEELAPAVDSWDPDEFLDTISGRPAPRFNLSVKLSSLYSQIRAVDPAGSAEAIKHRLRPILESARAHRAAVCLDMEQYGSKEIVFRVFRELFMEPAFRDWPDVGLAVQAYLRDTPEDLAVLIDWAAKRGAPVTVRLVRGAYWDYETVLARQNRWAVPVWTNKAETDRCFEHCLGLLMANYPHVEVAAATHNVRSLALAMALAEQHDRTPNEYELQMLHGMADPLKDAVVQMNHRLRVYVPFGELIPGMAYLVRRLLENTASQSFLRLGFAENLPPEALLAAPDKAGTDCGSNDASPRGGSPAEVDGFPPFANEPVFRFTRQAERDDFSEAINRVRARLGRQVPLLIGGEPVMTEGVIVSVNPARPQQVVGRVCAAEVSHADSAIAAAREAFPAWRDRSAADRAGYLIRAAQVVRDRRREMAAWQIFEAGKSWSEADADVTEAIDFLEYYARQAMRLDRPLPLHVPGEENVYFYQPRGVGVVIAPWNFPLAIMTGMLSATIVTGNTAVVKPSSQTPVVAARLVEILQEVGLPGGVVNFLPGPGGRIGDHLVRHPDTYIIAFTGSREVGARMLLQAAELQPGQDHIKRVIAELGGKNAIIVDSDADVDDAVLGTVVSAFGYQGQKCSAASRVIVVGGVYETFCRRLVDGARSLRIGPPEEPANFVGPVIDPMSRHKLMQAIEEGKKRADCLLETDVSHLAEGYYVGPTIFAHAPQDGPLAQEEFFGPILTVFHAESFDEALRIANATTYALTGGVYSRSPAHLERAGREFCVGNLYLNRKISGAIVGRQPFGGFKLSGVGSKAGGPDYLLQFVEPRTVTENTIRRGFSPDSFDDVDD